MKGYFTYEFVHGEIQALLAAHPELAEDDVLRADMIEGSTQAFDLLRHFVRLIQDAQALADATGQTIGELEDRKLRFQQREQVLRTFIKRLMNTADLTKAELPEATLSIRPGQQSVIITDEKAIPSEFMRHPKPEPKRTELKAAMKAGEHVPGAMLSNAEPMLQIRVK